MATNQQEESNAPAIFKKFRIVLCCSSMDKDLE
jgi:hypothetical protein